MTRSLFARAFPVLAAAALSAGLAVGVAPAALAQATDLVCTGCVQNSDLGNGAVSAAKISGGAVTNGKIANSAVNSVKLATGAVTAPKIGPGAVNASKIVTGAVTAPKIGTGAVNVNKLANAAVSTAKIQTGAVTGSRLADGAVSAAKLGLANTIYVEAAGPAETDNCNALLDALSAASGATAADPVVIVLGPGTYDCGSNPVTLIPFVELRGTSRRTTFVIGSPDGSNTSLTGLIRMASNSAVRDLTVRRNGSDSFQAGISANAASDIEITDVVSEGFNSVGGFSYGLRFDNSDGIYIENVIATADGGTSQARGIVMVLSTGVAVNLSALGQNASGVNGGGQTIGLTCRNCVFEGSSWGINVGGNVISSQVINGVGSGSPSCVGSYDENFQALNASCL